MSGKRRRGLGLIACGLLLLGAAAALAGFNLAQDRQAGARSGQMLEQLQAQIPHADPAPQGEGETGPDASGDEVPSYILDPGREMPEADIDGRACIGVLEIDALGLTLPILSQWSGANLNYAPCRYSGSAYSGGFVIAGHNYRSHFAALNQLSPGGEIRFTDLEGNVFVYQMAGVEVLQPTAIQDMVSGQWDLTLFTCTYTGQARLTVRCVLIDALPA